MKATDFWIGCHIYKSCRSFEKFWDFGHFSRSFEGERAILLEGCQCSAVHIPKSNIFLPWRSKSAEILKFDVSWNNWISVQQEKKEYLDFYSEFIPYHSSVRSPHITVIVDEEILVKFQHLGKDKKYIK